MGAAPGPGAGAGGGGGRIAATGVVATGAEGTAGAGGGATGIAPEKSKNPLIIMPDFFLAVRKITHYHSMATANLNKSEELVTNTTTASKRPRVCIN